MSDDDAPAVRCSAWMDEWDAALTHATAGRDSAPHAELPLWLRVDMAEAREAVRRVSKSVRRHSSIDPKLSDGGAWRGSCVVGGKAAAEAGAVTHGAVRCSAWLALDRFIMF